MQYRAELTFLHVIGAIVWIGGMVSMRFAAHYAFLDIATPTERLPMVSHALKRLFYIVFPFVVLLVATGEILTMGYDLKHTDFSYLSHIKEAIWTVMLLNLVAMMIRRAKADKAMVMGDYKKAGELLGLIGKAMVPVNIVLGIAAVIVGVSLRIYL